VSKSATQFYDAIAKIAKVENTIMTDEVLSTIHAMPEETEESGGGRK